MGPRDELNQLLATKFDSRLQKHLSAINLTPISRIAAARLQRTAIPNLALIELVSGNTFAEKYDQLYHTMFHGGERERSDLIEERLRQDFAGARTGLAPYRILGIQDQDGRAIAGAHFSVLFVAGERFAVPYLQYIYVRPESRRQDLSELLHTLVLAVAMADAAAREDGEKRIVPFTLFETEPPCHGVDEGKRAKAEERTRIHAKSGSLTLMVRRKGDGKIMSAHVQPGLEPDDKPLTLVWALRANPAWELVLDGERVGHALLAAYYRSLRDEGFPEKNIALGERMAEARCRGCEFVLLPLASITRDMYVDIDGASSS